MWSSFTKMLWLVRIEKRSKELKCWARIVEKLQLEATVGEEDEAIGGCKSQDQDREQTCTKRARKAIIPYIAQ